MIYNGFCNGSNPSQSVIADGEVCFNWYQERVESQYAPTGAALYPTPGFKPFVQVSDVTSRAMFQMAGRAFAIIGPTLYEIFATATVINRGTVAVDNNPATICSNGVGGQLGITSGANWYTYDLNANTLSQVAALNGRATMGGMKDGFFLCFNVKTSTVFVSNLNDGLTWNTGLMFFQRSIAPDPWQAMVVGNPYIYLIGEQTAEAWYDAGNSPQPFAPILSSFMQFGTPAPFSVALMEDAMTWLSRDRNGQAIVVSARGYSPAQISNYAVETAIQAYARTSGIGDCELMCYQDQGHLFGNFNFPMANGTWTVDTKGNGIWGQRGFWNTTQHRFDIWRPRTHMSAFGLHLVGDRSTGIIATMDVTFGTETDGSVIRRVRVGPPLWASTRQRLQVNRFQVHVEPGLGLNDGSMPMMMFQWSKNGKTWSNERTANAGEQGQYNKRVYWNRCGSSAKLWVPQISVSDPIPWRLAAAEIDGAGFQQLSKAA